MNRKTETPRRGAGFLCTLLIVLAGVPAFAQSEPGPATDQAPAVDRLLKRIDELEASQKRMQEKIDQLSGVAGTAAAPVAAASPAPPVVAVEPEPAPEAIEATDRYHHLGPVQFQGFSDFDYGRAWFEKLPPGGLRGSPRSFNIGDFDLLTLAILIFSPTPESRNIGTWWASC